MTDAMTIPEPSRLDTEVDDTSYKLSGVIDAHTAAQLTETLQSTPSDTDITVDLSQVEFIDSSGLRALVTAHQEHDAAGSRLLLAHLSDPVSRLLEITGLLDHLHVDGDTQ